MNEYEYECECDCDCECKGECKGVRVRVRVCVCVSVCCVGGEEVVATNGLADVPSRWCVVVQMRW